MRLLLYPLSLLYQLITSIRNFCYDVGVLPSRHFSAIQTIVVGNLTLGGTGKTPHVLFLAERLYAKYRIGILSRGYGRKTKGFWAMNPQNASPQNFGDEMMIYYHYFTQKQLPLRLYVSESRVGAIERILPLSNPPDLLLLDDGFQHRSLRADKYILLTDYYRLFTEDSLLPAGRLRETPAQAARADVVLVTKTPADLTEPQKQQIKDQVSRYTAAPVFFTALQYGEIKPLFGGDFTDELSEVILLTSIAFTRPLVDYLAQKHIAVVKHFDFPDHYQFTAEDIKVLINFYHHCQSPVLCTFKDAVKLSTFAELSQISIGYIPVDVVFCEKEYEFWKVLDL